MANELILIIEDDDSSRKLLRDTLQVTGYRTLESVTGEEGIRLATEHRPSLILMDIQLPGISGVAALQALRSASDTRAIPVIAVTASVMSAQQNELTRAGFDALESKPISVSGLLRKIRAKLDAPGVTP